MADFGSVRRGSEWFLAHRGVVSEEDTAPLQGRDPHAVHCPPPATTPVVPEVGFPSERGHGVLRGVNRPPFPPPLLPVFYETPHDHDHCHYYHQQYDSSTAAVGVAIAASIEAAVK